MYGITSSAPVYNVVTSQCQVVPAQNAFFWYRRFVMLSPNNGAVLMFGEATGQRGRVMRDHQFELFVQGRAVAAAMPAVQVFGRREAKVLASSMDRRGDLISVIMAGLNIDRLKPRCKSEKFWSLLVQSCIEHKGSVCQEPWLRRRRRSTQ